MAYTQANRPLRVTTPLGADALLPISVSGSEGISTPFRFVLDLVSEDDSIAADSLLRKPLAVTLDVPDAGTRTIHGLVNRFVQLGKEDDLVHYEAEVVPWLWFLSLSRDCKIFQNLTVPEIVETVFKAQGYTDFENRCTGAYPKREFCVQYLVIVVGTACQRVDGTPLENTVRTFGNRKADVWAMDRYGNLFVKDPLRVGGKGYFNHSSFCAGSDVVCAGQIMFNPGGRLTYIDNASGHYKPDRRALHAAVTRLQAEGLPMTDLRVGVYLGEDDGFAYFKAATFLANPNGPGDWDHNDNARLDQPEVIMA